MDGCLRCSNCGVNWPHDVQRFSQCPECKSNTRWGSGDAIDQSELNHRLFEVFYAWREKQLAERIDECEPAAAELQAMD